MMEWKPIETALKDGSVIRAKRVIDGKTFYEGLASWRTVRFEALYDPITHEKFADEEDATGWMRAEIDKRFPEPTHWKPASTPCPFPDNLEGWKTFPARMMILSSC